MSVILQPATNGGSYIYTYPPSSGEFALKQDYKTIAGVSILGTGDVSLKTINGVSVLGTGDITISVPSSLDLGEFSSLAALVAAHPTGTTGQYARVRTSLRTPPKVLWWDVQNATWDTLGNSLSLGASAATLAGRGNIAAGEGAVVLGGGTLTAPTGVGFIPIEQIAANQANGWCNLIGSGTGNVTNGICSSILNGQRLTIDAALSTIINGKSSAVEGLYNLVGTGFGHTIEGGDNNVILSGTSNKIQYGSSKNSTILGGGKLTLTGSDSVILSGGDAVTATVVSAINSLLSNIVAGASLSIEHVTILGVTGTVAITGATYSVFVGCNNLSTGSVKNVTVLTSDYVAIPASLQYCTVLSSYKSSPRVNHTLTHGLDYFEDHSTLLVNNTNLAETFLLKAAIPSAVLGTQVVSIPQNCVLTGVINLAIKETGTDKYSLFEVKVKGIHTTAGGYDLKIYNQDTLIWEPFSSPIIARFDSLGTISMALNLISGGIYPYITSSTARPLKAGAKFNYQIIRDL